jgi:hypothetical protein
MTAQQQPIGDSICVHQQQQQQQQQQAQQQAQQQRPLFPLLHWICAVARTYSRVEAASFFDWSKSV